ncbi:hypothetical protein N9X90_01460 [Alphaproteobacteria bacterium]|jgi:hypothetical protein|nr:hypothetical protein [Alphaproteobacteria bacterium]
MAISKDDIVERSFHITNNNAIDIHVGKRVRNLIAKMVKSIATTLAGE